MKKVALFSLLLVIGLIASQTLPLLITSGYPAISKITTILTMIALAFLMIHVGYEFELDKSRMKSYGWDYIVAMTAAAFPWILVTLYFVFFMLPSNTWGLFDSWKETLLAGRFAAPTSAGVLFSMLAAAGLSVTWLFKKARVLAIFDDLDTVLLMIPLKMLIVGIVWQLSIIVLFMLILIWIAWKFLHQWEIPVSWNYVLLYAIIIVAFSEIIYQTSRMIDNQVPIHLEVLLPAFVLGCLMKYPQGTNPHLDDVREGHQEGPESRIEQKASTIISSAFMVLVGMSMPQIINQTDLSGISLTTITANQPMPEWSIVGFHVIIITVLSNVGKMFPLFCYRKEVHWKERMALSVGLWPRGEVGAGVLVVSLSYGIGGPIVVVAVLSLALNLILTGAFILIVKKLLADVPQVAAT